MTTKRYFVASNDEAKLLKGRPRDAHVTRYTIAINKGKTYPVRSVKRGAPKMEAGANGES